MISLRLNTNIVGIVFIFVIFGQIQADEDVHTCKKCPTDKVLLLNPAKGFGKLFCVGPGDSCSKISNISCVGYSVVETGQCSSSVCYDWYCHDIPSKMNTKINIDGPDYDTIRISIEEINMIFILVILAIFFTICAISPELAFGIIIGASLFDDDSYESQSFRS